jgi:aspartyl-tRNA(Asn)/glutamyl-tRNA(Gln) amidotransferase subunit A
LPIAIKDALCTHDAPTTAASKILTRDGASYDEGWRPAYDCTAVARLRAADAIIIGKTNMDEFAMGSSNENSGFGATRNPWDRERIPGGSSGASAACVAAGSVPASLGSDTGGSIRQPASHCGVVGIKPSYGRVSRFGLIAFASSLDQIGPMASDVRGAARVLEVIAGPDHNDSTCSPQSIENYEAACDQGVDKLRVGIPKEYFSEGLEPEVQQAVTRVVDALRSSGCQIEEVTLPHTKYGISTYYLVATAEASSNLSRFDGVRFGLRSEKANDLVGSYEQTRGAGFGTEVKRRIMLGTYALSSGYYDAYYRKAQQVRTLIRRDFTHAFSKVDALITPVSPSVAFRLGEKIEDPLTMYLADVYTLPASLAGICGMSVPAALSTPTEERPALPVGVQVLAPAFAETVMLRVAAAWEAQSPVRGRLAPR